MILSITQFQSLSCSGDSYSHCPLWAEGDKYSTLQRYSTYGNRRINPSLVVKNRCATSCPRVLYVLVKYICSPKVEVLYYIIPQTVWEFGYEHI